MGLNESSSDVARIVNKLVPMKNDSKTSWHVAEDFANVTMFCRIKYIMFTNSQNSFVCAMSS